MLKLKLFLVLMLMIGISMYSHAQQDSNFVKRTPVSGSLSTSFGKVAYWDMEKQKVVYNVNYALALSAGVCLGANYNLSVSFNLPFNNKVTKNLPWLSDYSFALNRNKYSPNTFFWGYSNYGQNKYSNSLRRVRQCFATGNFFLGYTIKIPDKMMEYLKIHSSSALSTSVQLNYAIKYFDKKGTYSGGLFEGKSAISVNVKYIIIHNYFISGAVSYYFRQDIKLPWDSDYAYGFGFENWKPWKLTFSYANYMNTFPWKTQPDNSGFLYGTFTLSFNYAIDYKKRIN